jgi:hypothetical protein
LLWSRRFGALLGDAPPPDARMAFLARRGEYKELFESLGRAAPALAPRSSAGPLLERPWPAPGTNRFWRGYLAPTPLADVSGSVAWRRLVPLRRHESPTGSSAIELPKEAAGKAVVRAQSEALFHAHAVSFALHMAITAEKMSLEAMARACVALRTGKVFVRPGAAPMRADEFAAEQLAVLLREALGPSGPAAAGPPVGFSLFTVLQGDGVDVTKAVKERGALHRALEAVTQWSPTWDANPLPPLDANRIPTRRAPPGHLMYGRGNGRAVWEPQFFLPSKDGTASLSCYHRNLFAGMLQTEALLGFASLTENAAASGHLSPAYNEMSRPVVQQLLAIHAGDRTKAAYRSDCLRVQIDQHPLRPFVDALAARLWMKERLALSPPRA